MRIFNPKSSGASIEYAVDYAGPTPDLLTGETLVSIYSTSFTVLSGTPDPNIGSMPSGAPQIKGTKVVQLFTGGITGNRYAWEVLALTSLGRIIDQGGILTITPAYLQ